MNPHIKNILEAEAVILDKECTDDEMEQIALIENVQREDQLCQRLSNQGGLTYASRATDGNGSSSCYWLQLKLL